MRGLSQGRVSACLRGGGPSCTPTYTTPRDELREHDICHWLHSRGGVVQERGSEGGTHTAHCTLHSLSRHCSACEGPLPCPALPAADHRPHADQARQGPETARRPCCPAATAAADSDYIEPGMQQWRRQTGTVTACLPACLPGMSLSGGAEHRSRQAGGRDTRRHRSLLSCLPGGQRMQRHQHTHVHHT